MPSCCQRISTDTADIFLLKTRSLADIVHCPDLGLSVDPKSSLLLSSLLNQVTLVLALYGPAVYSYPSHMFVGEGFQCVLESPMYSEGSAAW